MKKETETGLLVLGLVILAITIAIAIICPDKTKTVLESLAIVTGYGNLPLLFCQTKKHH